MTGFSWSHHLEIKPELIKLADAAKRTFNGNVKNGILRPPIQSESVPTDGGTGGFWLSVGRLDRVISLEFWLDHYAGLSSPRLWMGFSAGSRGPIARLVELAKIAGFKYEPIKFTTRNITRRKPYGFIRPLREDQFERLVYEAYANDIHYLGIFKKYSWPFSPRDRKLILNEFENLVGRFTAALE